MRVGWALLGVSVAGCSLFTSLDGLSGGDDTGSISDAATPGDTNADAVTDSSGAFCDGGTCDAGCTGLPGPTMVSIGSACIDSTEVTYAQYRDFMDAAASSPTTFPQPTECTWNTSFTPSQGFTSTDLPYPAAYVNWCDAHAYCEWAGKELCGSFDGGATRPNGWTDPNASIWMNACTKGGLQNYPYGTTYQPDVCNVGQGDAASSATPAGSIATCVGGYPGLFDMIGNIKEWENLCAPSGGDPSQDQCRRRGSGFDEVDSVDTNCAWDETDTRDHTSYTTGFRCCKRP
ncbi:MAG: SUMF1/EgtB/PvdO family nonheme iron enzyme [Polyangiaceae bacterium]